MALIRFGGGSQLYIYQNCGDGYTCCQCPIDILDWNGETKDQLIAHILRHKQFNHSIGYVGDGMSYQSYDELLEAVERDDF